MNLPNKRKVAAICGDGHLRLVEEDVPELVPGSILVEVHASLVSPGTDLGGWRQLNEKRKSPDPDTEPRPFGYANAGIVRAAGDGARFQVGDRVVCMGARYALHTDVAVVPHRLAVHLPDDVTFVQGAYAHLAATALHSLRRADLEFGETYAVAGLGLVGQLAAQLHCLSGNYVIGWDTIPFRTETAEKWGIHATVTVGAEDPVQVTHEFTGGCGLDGGLIALGGDAGEVVQNLSKCMKRSPDGHPMGVIVVVGGADFAFSDHQAAGLSNIDIRRAGRTGPGYHDEEWEFGLPYPPVFMRWTTTTNLELCMRLIAEGRLDVDVLTTHEIPLDEVDEGTSAALEHPDGMLGVAFVPHR